MKKFFIEVGAFLLIVAFSAIIMDFESTWLTIKTYLVTIIHH